MWQYSKSQRIKQRIHDWSYGHRCRSLQALRFLKLTINKTNDLPIVRQNFHLLEEPQGDEQKCRSIDKENAKFDG